MSTDASFLDDRKAGNNVRTVTFCFLIVLLLLHGVGVGQGRVRAVFSSEQEKKKCRMYGENFFSVYVSRLDR